jgi:hypothetical protein
MKTFASITACSPARNDTAAGSLSSFEKFSGKYRSNKKTVKK